jgi:hypothetical protein
MSRKEEKYIYEKKEEGFCPRYFWFFFSFSLVVEGSHRAFCRDYTRVEIGSASMSRDDLGTLFPSLTLQAKANVLPALLYLRIDFDNLVKRERKEKYLAFFNF